MDKCLSPMSLETISDGSAESVGSPVNLLGFNLEFLGQELIENIIPHCVWQKYQVLFVSSYCKVIYNFQKLTLSCKVNIFSLFPV